jgi:hypothetical protein
MLFSPTAYCSELVRGFLVCAFMFVVVNSHLIFVFEVLCLSYGGHDKIRGT